MTSPARRGSSSAAAAVACGRVLRSWRRSSIATAARRRRCSTRPSAAIARPRLRLLAKGANPNAPGPDGTTAIMWAASNDDLELVRALIKAGANVKLKNQFGTSALTEAAIIGSAPVIDALLKAGADPNTKNPEGETPLMAVARSGKVDAARRLLDAGADVNAKEELGRAVGVDVGRRAKPGRDGQVPGLAGRRPQCARRHPPVGTQGHHRAASEGPEQGRLHPVALCRARGLCRVRAAPDRGRRRSRSRRSGAHHAAQHGAAQSALRVRRVPDQGRRRRRQMGSLRPLAALHGRRRQHAADEGQRRDGRDPERGFASPRSTSRGCCSRPAPIRIFSSSAGRRIAMCRRIAAATRSWRRARPPLLRAARAGDAPFVELLLKHKALVDLPSKEGVTPLMAAAGVEFGTRVTRGRNRTNEGVLATMQLLLDAGADINARMVTEPRRVVARRRGVRAPRPRPAAADEAVRCRARRPCRTRPHCTARQSAASRPS